jgi:hypothetical protein
MDEVLPQAWLDHAKCAAKVVASNGLPPACVEVFKDNHTMQEFITRKTKYMLHTLAELCMSNLSAVPGFSKLHDGFKKYDGMEEVTLLKLERFVGNSASSSSWRDLLVEMSETGDISGSISRFVSKAEQADAASKKAQAPLPATPSTSGASHGLDDASNSKPTLMCKVYDLNSFVGGPALNPDLLSIAAATAGALSTHEDGRGGLGGLLDNRPQCTPHFLQKFPEVCRNTCPTLCTNVIKLFLCV